MTNKNNQQDFSISLQPFQIKSSWLNLLPEYFKLIQRFFILDMRGATSSSENPLQVPPFFERIM